MRFLKEPVERKLSAALGARVSIERLSVSLLGGSLEVSGVTVAAWGASEPVLTVRRVKAEIAMGAILRKEVSIKSIVIEGPVLTIVRNADGSTNVPKRDATPPRATINETEQADDDAPAAWNFAAAKAQVLDGSVHHRDGAYHASAERIVGELLQRPDGFQVTILAASVGRRDEVVDLGEARASATLGAQHMIELATASLDGTFEVGDAVSGFVRAPSLTGGRMDIEIRATLDFDLMRKLLPARSALTPPRPNPSGVVA